MNGRPKSIHAMRRIVDYAQWECSTPALQKHYAAHKSMLRVFSTYADYKTGENARVSNEMLVKATGLSERFIQYQLPVLEFELGLITCTGHRHGGRGLAPVWKIELSNPAFPDLKGCTEDSERVHDESLKGAQSTDKGCTLHAPHPNPPSSNPTPPPTTADGKEEAPKGIDDFMAELPDGMEAGLSTKWLAKQIATDGYDRVRRVALYWYDKRPLGGMRSPGHFFQKEYPAYLKKVLKEIEKERIENDPVLKAEREARIRKWEDENPPLAHTLPDREEEPIVEDLEDLL
jgi:hypothetical protein